MTNIIKRLLLTILLLTMMLGMLLGWRVWQGHQTLSQITVVEHPVVFSVAPGDHLKKVCYSLYQMNLISDPKALYYYGRYHALGRAIKVGEFELSGAVTPIEILTKLTTNEVKQYKITFAEGITLKQMLRRVADHDKLTHRLRGDDQQQQAALLNHLSTSETMLEGWLFPSTYRFPLGTTDLDIVQQSHQQMARVLAHEWANRAEDLPYRTPYEALIMASIIEKETGVAAERQQIAGVFVRRLKRGMRLQTDPTVIYGLGDAYRGNLKRSHLRDQSNPYNTYAIKGLPPTPIAMPGEAAIHAALHPADGQALYFVAKGDGAHYFSETLEEHNSAVKRYQLKRRQDYRSTQQ